jgi:hypothetical protein
MDPSANNSRRRLGILKATKNVSAVPVAPKKPASIMSFTYPRIRLIKVAIDIMPAAFAIRLFSSNIVSLYFKDYEDYSKKREEGFAKSDRFFRTEYQFCPFMAGYFNEWIIGEERQPLHGLTIVNASLTQIR